jgi:hypothetical protein
MTLGDFSLQNIWSNRSVIPPGDREDCRALRLPTNIDPPCNFKTSSPKGLPIRLLRTSMVRIFLDEHAITNLRTYDR